MSLSGSRGKTVFGFGSDLSPALVAVGFIVGRNISILVFAGGMISWLLAIPIYSYFTGSFAEVNMDMAYEIWNAKIRYLGVGAMVVGGIWSVINLMNPLMAGIKSSLNAYRRLNSGEKIQRTEMDIPIKWVVTGLLLATIPLFLLYADVLESLDVAFLLVIVMLVFGFLFSAVAGYMSGLVGSSNNPVSGVTIATILFTSLLLLAIKGTGSMEGAAGAIIIGAVVCCAAAIAGDNMQDLKAGYIVGATPWKQQVMQVVGTVSAALALGLTLDILHSAYTIGSETLPAPQATLMKSVADGVFSGELPWDFVFGGAIIGVAIILIDSIQKKRGSEFRVPILAVAVGLYLPITLSVPIFIGGMISYFAKRANPSEEGENKGLLFASGLITGEALVGILVALPIFITANKDWWPTIARLPWLGVSLFILVSVWLYYSARKRG